MDKADESLAELFEQYKDEVREAIGALDTELVRLEQDQTDSEVIFSIFRHLHSMKGASKMFNVDNIGDIAHKLEDLMQIIDGDNAVLGRHPGIIDLLFRGNDIFREIITRLEGDTTQVNLTPGHAGFIEEVNRRIEAIGHRENALVEAARGLLDELEEFLPAMKIPESAGLRRAMDRVNTGISLAARADGPTDVRYSYQGVDLTQLVKSYESGLEKLKSGNPEPEAAAAFFGNAETMLQAIFEVAEGDIMGVLQELNDGLEMHKEINLDVDPVMVEFFSFLMAELKDQFQTEAGASVGPAVIEVEAGGGESVAASDAPFTAGTKTIRVDEKKVDLFLDSVGQLIAQSEVLNHLQYSFERSGINPALVRDFAAVNQTISNDIISLQRSIMEVRQVEMGNILKTFPRLVRDVSHKMGKDVELIMSGERIPIDKSLLDDVEQVLIHIVRNAIDHGLETPEERVAAGKGPRGRISIQVAQEEASVFITVSDDGRGIDMEAVRQRAADRGIVSAERAAAMTEEEAAGLVFRSGLTTKAEATDISGRGVGLDVVLSNVKKWRGEVHLDNRPGRGVTLSLRIPRTNILLTKEAILLRLGACLFCLPLEIVLEIVTVPQSRIHRHKRRCLFQHRGKIISVVDLKSLLGITDSESDGRAHTFIILRGAEDDRKAIAADEILDKRRIVVKDFDIEFLRRLPYCQGLTLLGDGRVALILDAERITE